MSWVVFAILAVVAIAAAKSVTMHQETKPTPVATSPKEAVLAPAQKTCTEEMRFCTMEFRPRSCSVDLAGKRFEAQGNNGCEANEALLKMLCAAGIRSISAAEAGSVVCVDASGAQGNQ